MLPFGINELPHFQGGRSAGEANYFRDYKRLGAFAKLATSYNCEVEITRRSIWIVAIRDILTGEELRYNYGYGMETYGDFPCNCKAKNCVRYILAEEYWGLIKKK